MSFVIIFVSFFDSRHWTRLLHHSLLVSLQEEEDDAAIDKTSATMEFEGGAGGQESMIFNGEIFEMYLNFAKYRV